MPASESLYALNSEAGDRNRIYANHARGPAAPRPHGPTAL
jgi:hypothetical protein